MPVGEAIQSPCNSCGQITQHEIVHERLEAGEDHGYAVEHSATRVIGCRGCGCLTIRREELWTEKFPGPDEPPVTVTETSFHPYRTWVRPPSWLKQLESLAPDLADILGEIYTAANDRQSRLLAMGVRTAVDFVMTQRIGDVGGFDQKLTAMVTKGHLTAAQKDTLETVIDAGSAAAHRGFKPPQPLLLEMIAIMESMIRDLYITGPMMKSLKTIVPPRPPRPPKTPSA